MRPSKAAVHSGLRQEQSAMAEGATLSGMPCSCRSTETTESNTPTTETYTRLLEVNQLSAPISLVAYIP